MQLVNKRIKGRKMSIPHDGGGIHPFLRNWTESSGAIKH